MDDVDLDDDEIFDVETDEINLDDEFYPAPDDEEAEPAAGNGAPQQRSAMPMWLSKNYADVRERITSEIKKGGKPLCYQRGTFWDGSPFPFFEVQQLHVLRPEQMYQPTYFVWLPHLLLKGRMRIPCPNCAKSEWRDNNGDIIMLRSMGFPKVPCCIVDLDQCIRLVGYCYSCRNPECKKTYLSWSPTLLAALP